MTGWGNRIVRGTAMGVLAFGLMHPPAWAARTRIHEAAESNNYGTKFAGMIGRGLLNASTCFVDIIVNTVQETKNGPPFVGTLTGVAKGTGCGVLRVASGGIDLLTFWVPGFNGIPVSDSYDNCLAVSEARAYSPNQASPEDTSWTEISPPSGGSTTMSQSAQGAADADSKPKWKK